MAATSRLLELLQHIPRLPRKMGTTELLEIIQAKGFGVKLRTIQRDLVNLSLIFPITNDEKNPQGWHWAESDQLLQFPTLDPRAALTLQMAEKFLSNKIPPNCLNYLGPHFQMADHLLNGKGNGGIKGWAEKIEIISRSQPLLPPAIEPNVLGEVYDALLYERKFQATYRGRGKTEVSTYPVNPLGLVFADQVVYLVCTLYDYSEPGDVLFLILHRMLDAKPLEVAAKKVRGFNLKAYVDSGAFGFGDDGETLRLKALFSDGAAHHLSESKLSRDQTITKKGKDLVLVEATVLDTAQLRWWLLGFGAQVEIVGPKHLRAELAETCRAMAAAYA